MVLCPCSEVVVYHPRNLIVKLLVHHVDKSFWRLVAKHLVLVGYAWSHVIYLSNDLFTVANQFSFVVKFSLVFLLW